MLTFVLCVLGLWCLYNTIAIKLNAHDDKRGEWFDSATVKILKIHCERLDKIEHFIEDLQDDIDD